MIRQLMIALGVIAPGVGYEGIGLAAIQCPPASEQTSRDYDADISGAVETFRRLSGVELRAKGAGVAKDLIGRLPGADRVYMEQMMYASYCSSLNEDKTLSDSERREELKKYNSDVRKAMEHPSSVEKQPAAVPPPSKRLGKKKARAPQSKVNPPVTPLTQAETKQLEMQKPQPTVSQNPRISQHSEGSNSPNITGDRNVVIINPISEAKLDEMSALLRQKVDREKLRQKYPLGYLFFELDGNVVTPYETLSVLGEYQFDWTVVKVIQNTKDRIAIRLPDAKRKDGSLAISEAMTGGKKQVGNLGGVSLDDLIVWGERLAIRENGVVFLVGFEKMPLSKLIKK